MFKCIKCKKAEEGGAWGAFPPQGWEQFLEKDLMGRILSYWLCSECVKESADER